MLQSRLRYVVVASALALPLIPLMAHRALAAKSDFWVRNDSRTTVTHIYVSDSGRDTWDNDLLDGDTLASGEKLRVTFGDASSSRCLYDFRAEFSDGQTVEKYQINVCENDYFSLFDR